ncbi:GATA zinc finger domain-containing protein 14-like [Ruditapes philippinarum]|uniref:GATA zinc finger domain-containing protein 14-like n=1 Tax=Ruditapes philippinarum TaxID=129788 RepID=UPI00295B7856|nr:GATA zinc finger domain-containing protein 14-like [Ruditapes philippinarum]
MCLTSCVGQLLHADVLTEFFGGNSRHNVEHNENQVSKDETATTKKPTSQGIIPDTTQYSENSSKNNANITKSTTQHKTTSTLRQAEIDTTEQTTQELLSTTPSLAIINTQQIPHVSSRNLTKQTEEVIQPPIQFQMTTLSMSTIQNEIWRVTSQQTNTFPLTSLFQITKSLAPLALSTSSLTTTATATTTIDMRDMNEAFWSTPPHSSNATKSTTSIPTHQKQITLSVTQRTNDLEIKNNSNVHSAYQTIDDKSKLNDVSGNKVLAAKDYEKWQNLEIRGSRVTVKSHRDSVRDIDRNSHDRNGESERNNRYNEKTYYNKRNERGSHNNRQNNGHDNNKRHSFKRQQNSYREANGNDCRQAQGHSRKH